MRYMVPIIIEADSPDEAVAEFTSARYVADVEVGPPMRIDPPADALVPREPLPMGPDPLADAESPAPSYRSNHSPADEMVYGRGGPPVSA